MRSAPISFLLRLFLPAALSAMPACSSCSPADSDSSAQSDSDADTDTDTDTDTDADADTDSDTDTDADADTDSDADTDTSESEICDCEIAGSVAMGATATGGFDDWAGTALGWAVDAKAGRVLVAAMSFDLPTAEVDLVPACEDAEATVHSWTMAVPPSATAAASSYPLLRGVITDAVGIRSLAVSGGALLAEGDIDSPTPDRVWVASGGHLTLVRGDGSSTLRGSLEFAGRADAAGGDLVVDCPDSFTLTRVDIEFVGTGSD